MKFERSGGILLHPTSLSGPYGIGDLGPQAYRFVDWLESTGCKLWQILPLGPTGYGDSPYQCFSAFAGNPYLISPDMLIQDGLLTQTDLISKPNFNASRVDFGLLIPWKLNLLQKAFTRFALPEEHRDNLSGATTGSAVEGHSKDLHDGFEYFCAQNVAWLDDYSLFMALKESNGGNAWNTWAEPLRTREKSALDKARGDTTKVA